ncbi:MAG: hypothetical protein ACLGIT_16095 [Gammaproteobacteria bacterium]|uniref:hypothetical protein n=1 Tax=Azohydromonas sp. TaxID=1872666 RepID=UPI002B72C4A2|nr:hypothetical protein [Azohydromonas sp.]HMM84020.1 hypothetical protein [Azohydromonas sp.]
MGALCGASLVPAVLRAQPLDGTQDLAHDIGAAAARGQPLLLLVSLDGCVFCDIVRRSYLLPLRAQGEFTRQIDLRGRSLLRGPTGASVRESDLARAWGVRVAPTLLFLGPGGTELAPRLAGYSEDFYGAYLDDALAQARTRLRLARG